MYHLYNDARLGANITLDLAWFTHFKQKFRRDQA